MILGLERDGYAIHMPDANMLINKGDILWIIGTSGNLSRIAYHSVGKTGSHTEIQYADSAEKDNGSK